MRNKQKRFFLICARDEIIQMLQGLWSAEQVEWTCFSSGSAAIKRLFNDPPDLLVVDADLPGGVSGTQIINLIKSENVYRQLPVVICLDKDNIDIDFSKVEADDFLCLPVEKQEARIRLELTFFRATRELDASPLTKLPGNTSIVNRIQDLIDRQEDFALIYSDLDHFKSFNDKYGFSRGDEVLLMTARIMVNGVRSVITDGSAFIGHVGGDDFVCIVPAEMAEKVCQKIIESFDSIVPSFYDNEDRECCCIVSTDRQGKLQTFPLMAISLAVVFNIGGKLRHFGQASQISMNLKKKAKKNQGSCYVLDKRQEQGES